MQGSVGFKVGAAVGNAVVGRGVGAGVGPGVGAFVGPGVGGGVGDTADVSKGGKIEINVEICIMEEDRGKNHRKRKYISYSIDSTHLEWVGRGLVPWWDQA